jgi:hypothetical protein
MRGEALMLSDCPCATNKDCQVRDHHASLIDENQVCGSGIQRLKQNRAVGPGLNVDDFRISDQHGFEGPLEHDSGPDAQFKRDAGAHLLPLGSGRPYRKSGRHHGNAH